MPDVNISSVGDPVNPGCPVEFCCGGDVECSIDSPASPWLQRRQLHGPGIDDIASPAIKTRLLSSVIVGRRFPQRKITRSAIVLKQSNRASNRQHFIVTAAGKKARRRFVSGIIRIAQGSQGVTRSASRAPVGTARARFAWMARRHPASAV
jgi:hypothetical protein